MDIGLAGGIAHGTTHRRRRMAIVSTFDDLCGIAGYTRRLVPQLEPWYDVEVLDLDQFLMRSPHRAIQRLAEKQINEFAARLKGFDCVNIQLEHGTLGRTTKQIIRRFQKLTKAAPELSVTFHTVMIGEPIQWADSLGILFKQGVGALYGHISANSRQHALSHPIYRDLRKLSRGKPVHTIVHNRRDMRLLTHVHRLPNVHHHPLAFLSQEASEEIRSRTTRASFPGLAAIPPDAKLVGTFGFLSPYKGFETVIQALKYLPDDYHVLIFGGIHPQTIKKGIKIDEYIGALLKEANIGLTVLDQMAEKKQTGVSVALDVSKDLEVLMRHPHDLSSRIHFMGALNDDEFAGAMAVCDMVVMPYLEVGQSSSGPISVALNMGCRVIASRTSTFSQFSRYYPDAIEFFDIGNYIELAQRIASDPPSDPRARELTYNTETNAEMYRLANSGLRRMAVQGEPRVAVTVAA